MKKDHQNIEYQKIKYQKNRIIWEKNIEKNRMI